MGKTGETDDNEEQRRRGVWLTDKQINDIAERAKDLAMQQVYAEVGKSAIRAALWILGAAVAVLAGWLGLSGKVP